MKVCSSLKCGCKRLLQGHWRVLEPKSPKQSCISQIWTCLSISVVLNYLLAESNQQKECPLNITGTVMDCKVLYLGHRSVEFSTIREVRSNFHAIMPGNINFLIYLYVNLAIIFKFVMLVLFHIAILYLGISPVEIFT